MSRPPSTDLSVSDRIRRLEERVAQLEARQGLADATVEAAGALNRPSGAADEAFARPAVKAEEFELEVGQNWFARVGIIVLTIGGVLMLSLPYAGWPAWLPTVAGYALTAGLFTFAHRSQRSFELVANYIRGAAMALFWFATLRLFRFGAEPVIGISSPAASIVLAMVMAANLALSFRRKSPRLTALALALGYASAIAVGSAPFVLGTIFSLAVVVAVATRYLRWRTTWFVATVLGVATYSVWVFGSPSPAAGLHAVAAPAIAPAVLLVQMAILAIAAQQRTRSIPDPSFTGISAMLNCLLGYGAFLLHTAVAFPSLFVAAHLIASLTFLALANLHWMRNHCRIATFFYAMTGYVALSMAIIKASDVPNLFVWLSTQSIVVVATAVWFRSRFIVVANFLIYVATVLGYMVLKDRETGISLAIGVVALLSARILNWQKDRLELKTELMRNAYLCSAFIVFPYALYHLVSGSNVGLAWVGLALGYYVLNLIVRSPKYRWMGHATLLLTTGYLVLVGTRKLEPVLRVVSFLALGTVLLIVSMTFARVRRKAGTSAPEP